MSSTLSISGLPSYKAASLRRVAFGWPSVAGFFIAICLLGLIPIQGGSASPLFVGIFILGFFAHVLHVFIKHKLESDIVSLADAQAPIAFLSADIVRELGNTKEVTMKELTIAALVAPRGRFLLEEMSLSAEKIAEACLSDIDDRIEVDTFLSEAMMTMKHFEEKRIDANIFLYLLFTHVDCFRDQLHNADLSEDDLDGLMQLERLHFLSRIHDGPFSPRRLARHASLGRSWVMGYTSALDALTSDINPDAHVPVHGNVIIHKDSIENALRTLAKGKQRNLLIMGKVGTGKQTLVLHIAEALRTAQREQHLPFTRVLLVHTEKLLSGVSNPDAFLLNALGRAQRSGHFILVIKDFSALLKSANQNLKNVIMKCLESQNMSVIAISDVQEYHMLIKVDASLDNRFEKVIVEDSTDEETLAVLMSHYFAVERSGIRMTYKALKSIVELSKRYMSMGAGFPAKALDVMDEAMARASEYGERYVTEAHVREVISHKSKVNVQKVTDDEKQNLLNLEEAMKNKIIGQEAAVKAVCNALKRARVDMGDRKRPVGTFLFLGPTGVGKTQTAKVLAEEYFGSADAILRLDMNEFSHADSVFNIIGSNSSGEGFLARRVQEKPFSLILLDEIEKAHPAVLNLFLQILDEGFLNDARGVRTDFRNTIIIATSNAGALFIRDFVRENQDFDKASFKSQLMDSIIREKLFTPEFVNRFDEIVLYYPLSQENAMRVCTLMVEEVSRDVQRKRGITVSFGEGVLEALVERGYSVDFGVREMRRTVTDMIENYLADYMLRQDVKRGDTIVIGMEDLRW